ncbi:MAG: hypothetical protein A3I75_02860 [Deltaproteobacteria bacterium RIFCSPLOWO2_02_FULL_50_16]|nr:MAG: hypothetical protein A2053_05480 [Deltaproteobacteria bacterium GWA2_50_8]OGQ26413.1 MAG: hypothetical protein A3B79_06950 [Deltaproteobacteria bacterium RIFCSPHIGHO2_02_FULL_50_15]OGQ56891.1 MAG: hypothetical protein A3I75_02860 [Deltaproteobacteria bacterium RIFCSPLOWO2_02_FULL_50_16]OGQ67931.1 MAG: hypothetical protein A3F89_03380 [Deltaproteobacteria bacterium RIFCSPLOWO2_12_FULL_50_11]
MSLSNLPINTEGHIVGYSKTLSPKVKWRLQELGFQEGQKVKCLRKVPFGGPRVFLIGDSVYSLASDVAHHILIERVVTQ